MLIAFHLSQNPVVYQEAVHTLSMAARSGHMVTNMASASKEHTPKVKVDMEAKLQLWLESKAKTKSTQRMNGLFSPTGWRTPSSMSHVKQPLSARVSGRAKAMDQDGAKIKKSVSPIWLCKSDIDHLKLRALSHFIFCCTGCFLIQRSIQQLKTQQDQAHEMK